MTSPFSSIFAFFGSTAGRIVLVGGGVLGLGLAGAIAGYIERQHPTLHVANVFSVPLEVRAGTQTVSVPEHGSVTIELQDKESRVAVLFQGREVDAFTPPYRFHVLNVLGAAPIVRQEVVWTPSKTDAKMMDGVPRPAKGTYCGAKVIDEMDADDILRAKPDEIVLQEGASTTETRKRLFFPKSSSPFECVRDLESKHRPDDAAKIRAFARSAGDVE